MMYLVQHSSLGGKSLLVTGALCQQDAVDSVADYLLEHYPSLTEQLTYDLANKANYIEMPRTLEIID